MPSRFLPILRECNCLPFPTRALLVFLSLCLASCDRPAETGRGEVPTPEPDAFCGLPVPDFETAARLIEERRDNFPKVGEPAVPFVLPSAVDGERVSLASLHGEKPLVLIFGSRSCSVLGRTDDWISAFEERFGRKVQFAFVYIRESHPSQGYQPRKFAEEVAPVPDAGSLERRRETAARYAADLGVSLPFLVDEMNDEVARRYSAWPVRLFVIDTDGTVLYSGGQAPWFYHPFRGYRHQAPVDPSRQTLPRSEMSLEEFLESHLTP